MPVQLPPNGYNDPSGAFSKPFSFEDFSKAFQTGWQQKHEELTAPTEESERQLHLAASKAKLAEDKAAELRRDAESKFHFNDLMTKMLAAPKPLDPTQAPPTDVTQPTPDAGPQGPAGAMTGPSTAITHLLTQAMGGGQPAQQTPPQAAPPPPRVATVPAFDPGDNPLIQGFKQPAYNVPVRTPQEAFALQLSQAKALAEAAAGKKGFQETPSGKVLDLGSGQYVDQAGTSPVDSAKLNELDTTTGRRENLLASLNPDDAAIVKAAADYQEDPFKALSKRSKGNKSESARINALILRYDPSWSPVDFPAKQKMLTDYASSSPGSAGGSIVALNNAIGHLHNLNAEGPKVASTNYPLVNSAENWLTQQTGGAGPTNFGNTRDNVATEVAKVIQGSGVVSREATDKAIGGLSTAASAEQKSGAIKTLTDLMLKRARELSDRYRDNLRRAPSQIISDESKQQLIDMGANPTDFESIDRPYAAKGSKAPVAKASADGIPLMNSPEEARKLPPGTKFKTPDGRILTR